jgi:hypothetical protein
MVPGYAVLAVFTARPGVEVALLLHVSWWFQSGKTVDNATTIQLLHTAFSPILAKQATTLYIN